MEIQKQSLNALPLKNAADICVIGERKTENICESITGVGNQKQREVSRKQTEILGTQSNLNALQKKSR